MHSEGVFAKIMAESTRFRGAALAASLAASGGPSNHATAHDLTVVWAVLVYVVHERARVRRTFIVNALSLGITPNIVMKWTGHSDYKAMKPYIDIVDSIKASSMTKFDGLI